VGCIILGVDPGTVTTGYAVIDGETILDFGCIRPPTKLTLPERYLVIFNAIEHLIRKFQPEAVSVETQFMSKNAQSTMKLSMARGTVMLAAAKNNVSVYEYSPRKAKQAIVGNGGASKEQVQRMLQILLKLPSLPEPADAADALALAMCHAHTLKLTLCKKKRST
jgi:crossover junction endodeoxyribonuclease RuvC